MSLLSGLILTTTQKLHRIIIAGVLGFEIENMLGAYSNDIYPVPTFSNHYYMFEYYEIINDILKNTVLVRMLLFFIVRCNTADYQNTTA